MSSGFKQMVINTQERAISTDINRLQRFKEKDVAELFRYLLDVVGGQRDLNAGGVITEPSTLETPLRAEIINGLMVKPQIASLNVLVDPGVLFALAPDAAVDESNYKFFNDAGVTSGLTMTANASGSIRIDVIECRVNPVESIITDNRDIFNPITGLFTATSVTKERAGRLEYRVRQGTPAGGMPALVAGWLPLVVASVPNATTTNDTITFWDVRPLLNDRIEGIFNAGRFLPQLIRAEIDTTSAGAFSTDVILSGQVDVQLNGRRIGGRLRTGVPGTDAETLTIGPVTTLHNDPTYVLGTFGAMVNLFLVTPFGLPRWARYTDFGSGSRIPRSPCGIPVITNVSPKSDGQPNAVITLPTATGLLGGTNIGFCIAVTCVYDVAPFKYENLYARGKEFHLGSGTMGQTGVATSATLAATSFFRTAGTHYPAHAKRVKYEIDQTFTAGATAGDYGLSTVAQHTAGSPVFDFELLSRFMVPATFGTVFLQRIAWSNVQSPYPPIGPGLVCDFRMPHSISPGTAVIGGFPFWACKGYEL